MLSRPIRVAHRELYPSGPRKMIARRDVYCASDRRVPPGAVHRDVIESPFGRLVDYAHNCIRVVYHSIS